MDFLYEKTVHDYNLQHPGVPQVLSILFQLGCKGGFLIWKTEGGKLASVFDHAETGEIGPRVLS